MRWRTVFVLAAVVAGLAFLVRRRAEEEASGKGVVPVQFAVAPEFAAERVTKIRVDNVERGVQVSLERDAVGLWYMTDPLAYPANQGVVDILLRTLASAYGEAAGAGTLAGVGLDPPKVVLHVTQAPPPDAPNSESRTYRIDVGAVDLDANRVYVACHDHPMLEDGRAFLMRTTRALYSTLDRNPDDYRDTRATHLSGRHVAVYERQGSVWLPDRGEVVDLALHARLNAGEWRRMTEPTVRLEPNAIGLLVRAAAELRVQGFEDDSPTTLEAYGLDPPMFTIGLEDGQGDRVTLAFGFPRQQGPGLEWSDTWYCQRLGYDHVWWIDGDDVMLLVRPADEVFDYFLVHAKRDSMARVELEAEGRVLTLERDPEGEDWDVFEVRAGESGPRYRASAGPLQDVLAALESTELEYPVGLEFEEDATPRAITLTTTDGRVWGGHLGTRWRDATTGTVGHRFRRYGDGLCGLVPEQVAELALLPIDQLRSARIHRVRAPDVGRVQLELGERRFTYLHPDDKRWLVKGSGFPAPREFVALTEHLFSLRAARWLDAAPESVSAALDVVLESRLGEEITFRLARGTEGELLCREPIEDGAWSVVDTETQRELFGRDLLDEALALFEE